MSATTGRGRETIGGIICRNLRQNVELVVAELPCLARKRGRGAILGNSMSELLVVGAVPWSSSQRFIAPLESAGRTY
jgi:hypothetical protein